MKVQFFHHRCGVALKQMFTFPLPTPNFLPRWNDQAAAECQISSLIKGEKTRGFLDGLFTFLSDQQYQPTLCICTVAASEKVGTHSWELGRQSFQLDQTKFTVIC